MKEHAHQPEESDCWLAVNAGSSSLKLSAFDPEGNRVFSRQTDELNDPSGAEHAQALAKHLSTFECCCTGRPRGVAHRVVHGGDRFHAPTRVDDAMLAALRDIDHLAPLHNPLAVACITAARQQLPDVEHYALFDTAFHHDLPPENRDYALPAWCREKLGIRRYGFHGLSVASALRSVAEQLGHPEERLNLIVAHLGNGASMTAVRRGKSSATSMGMTPLEGLVMGSRAGDIDPAIPGFLERHAGLTPEQIDHLLNRESGLTGLCGTRDLREIHTAIDRGDELAAEALSMYIHRIRHYLGGYLVNLGRLDALVFTGGVGEHDAIVRETVCEGLNMLGLAIDPDANRAPAEGPRPIHQPHSPAGIWIVPADEEGEMVRQLRDRH
ncbi:acetate/propionate family kinase [Guyparkeria sp.]|uniref:acetate/propionate family kinase n=1 Tax=Guyparkeria sp. TaxID=2035736 RepID=UPI003970FE62